MKLYSFWDTVLKRFGVGELSSLSQGDTIDARLTRLEHLTRRIVNYAPNLSYLAVTSRDDSEYNASSDTVITWDSVLDRYGDDLELGADGESVIARRAGIYRITYAVYFIADTLGVQIGIVCKVNGSRAARGDGCTWDRGDAIVNKKIGVTKAFLTPLSAGSTVSLYGNDNDTGISGSAILSSGIYRSTLTIERVA